MKAKVPLELSSTMMTSAALILWMSSLFLTGIASYSTENSFSGLGILAMGWLSPLAFNFAWFANLFFWWSAVEVFSGRVPLKASLLALLLSLDTIRFTEIVLNESGGSTPVFGYGWGAVLWFVAIVLMLAAVGARRRELGTKRDVLQPFALALAVLTIAIVGYLALHDRAVANSDEAERLTNIAFKRGKICAAPDPAVENPIKRLSGPLEILFPKERRESMYPFEDVERLLNWGIPTVRFNNVDYSLVGADSSSPCIGGKECKTWKRKSSDELPAAKLYVTKVYQKSIGAKLIETESGRVVFDQTWIREDYQLNTDIYCPAYNGFPSEADQPRRLLTQALGLRGTEVGRPRTAAGSKSP